MHTHPYATTELQRGCQQAHGNDVRYRRGALDPDKDTAGRLNNALPGQFIGNNGYVMDKHGIFKFGPRTRDNRTTAEYPRCGY
ncbi:hypothetical protein [Longimicrobium sp.]|uniref:hypothetical protein n=1 Tax=Longimicrobium sp. TaxID=2029185 RepID=UPI003B3ABABD